MPWSKMRFRQVPVLAKLKEVAREQQVRKSFFTKA
jgi:hypothetical protein